MDAYRAELVTVTQELSGIEAELDALLEKQTELLDRKQELETILSQCTSKSATQNIQWDKTDFKWSTELQRKLEDVYGIKRLRPMQLQTMNVTMSGKDCILIMPTGGGKSLCFQLPALLSKGITLVVSPLVSLMEDQVMALHGYSIDATMLNASTPKDVLKQVQQAMVDKNATLKLLYVTPEKLAKSKRFMSQLEKTYKAGRFARLVIDEVHCCSQWGHDFRPDYKFLGIMKRQFPDVPILGLTATATSSVLDDVKKILNIQHCQLFRASFNRPNLFYEVREKPSVQKDVMSDIQMLISSRFSNQSGIIYTFSKRESEEVTADLQSRGIKAGCYHADLSARERSRIHKAWIDNKVHVVVATVAFGMGIDKPDVRYVIHHSLSKSMENLYQESGRAGRDEKKSHCIVYYRLQDVFRQSCMVMAEQTGVRNLYGIMEYCVDKSKCRRSVIAKYFGEVWERSQCNKMCDHCSAAYEVEKKDVTSYCTNVLKIVDSANATDQKLTANKLLDAWQGKGPTTLRVKGTDTGTDRQKLEVILATLLLKEYLKEDFHFTPYSTISYLIPGRKAVRLRNGVEKVFIEFPGKVKKDTGASSSSTSKNLKVSALDSKKTNPSLKKSKSETDRPKLVVINTEKSAFTQILKTESSIDDGPPKVKKTNSLTRKRKPVIVESESDSESLDFGDSNSKSKGKKIKKSGSEENSGMSNGDTGKGSCAMLDRPGNSGKVLDKTPVVIDSDSDGAGHGDGSGKNDTGDSSWTEQDTAAAICLLDCDSDFDE